MNIHYIKNIISVTGFSQFDGLEKGNYEWSMGEKISPEIPGFAWWETALGSLTESLRKHLAVPDNHCLIDVFVYLYCLDAGIKNNASDSMQFSSTACTASLYHIIPRPMKME